MKILIAGYYGFKNLGDELILSKMIEDIRSIEKEAEIFVWSGDPDYTKKIHGVNGVNRFSAEAVREAIRYSDIVVVGGGGLIQEYFGIEITDIFEHFGYHVAAYSIVPLIARTLQKPIFYWSHGVGPIFTEEAKNFTKWFYTLPDFITLRDEESHDILKKIHPDVRNVYVDTDPTMDLDVNRFIKPVSYELPPDKIKIGINIRPWFGQEGIVKKISAGLVEFCERNKDCLLIPIPFDLSLDKETLRKLISLLPKGIVYEYKFEELETAEEVISLMDKVDFFCGDAAPCDHCIEPAKNPYSFTIL